MARGPKKYLSEKDPTARMMPARTKKPGRISKAGVGAKLKAGLAKVGRAEEKFSRIVRDVVSPLPGKKIKAAKLGVKAVKATFKGMPAFKKGAGQAWEQRGTGLRQLRPTRGGKPLVSSPHSKEAKAELKKIVGSSWPWRKRLGVRGVIGVREQVRQLGTKRK